MLLIWYFVTIVIKVLAPWYYFRELDDILALGKDPPR